MVREGCFDSVLANEGAFGGARVRTPDEVLSGRIAEQRAEEQVHVAQAPVQLAPEDHASLHAAHQRQVPEEGYTNARKRETVLEMVCTNYCISEKSTLPDYHVHVTKKAASTHNKQQSPLKCR